tara:strand:- start:85 stop:939 length:855 start_codon:yes stop_codon:yes gene_type:complete
MRRKFVNFKSLIYIVLIAVFTLLSYMSDQGIIRQEDNLRKSDIKIDNFATKSVELNTINEQLLSLQTYIIDNLTEFHRNQHFWIKSLILTSQNSKLADKKMIDTLNDYDYSIEMLKNRFINHYYQIIYNSTQITIKYQYIHVYNKNYFKDYFNGENYLERLDYDFEVIFSKNINSFFTKDFNRIYPPNTDKAVNEYNNVDFLDIYKFSHYLLNNLENYYDIIGEDAKKIDKFNSENEDLLYKEFAKNKKISSLKNYLVLLSIISQILSLFFLLLFFRNLLINKF